MPAAPHARALPHPHAYPHPLLPRWALESWPGKAMQAEPQQSSNSPTRLLDPPPTTNQPPSAAPLRTEPPGLSSAGLLPAWCQPRLFTWRSGWPPASRRSNPINMVGAAARAGAVAAGLAVNYKLKMHNTCLSGGLDMGVRWDCMSLCACVRACVYVCV